MVANLVLTEAHDVTALAEQIARELVHAKIEGNTIRFTTPVLFPSGAHISLRIHGGPSKFIVTDDGAAFGEAEMMGAEQIFTRAARATAQERGVRFNEHEIFEADAPIDRLSGFVAIVADAARHAVELTAMRLSEKIERETKAVIGDRLRTLYGAELVDTPAKYVGASTHQWDFDAVAHIGRGLLFAVTTPAPQSIAANFTKLDDIGRLDDAPKGIAMLTSRADFRADQLVILNRVARIIARDDSDSDYLKLAA